MASRCDNCKFWKSTEFIKLSKSGYPMYEGICTDNRRPDHESLHNLMTACPHFEDIRVNCDNCGRWKMPNALCKCGGNGLGHRRRSHTPSLSICEEHQPRHVKTDIEGNVLWECLVCRERWWEIAQSA